MDVQWYPGHCVAVSDALFEDKPAFESWLKHEGIRITHKVADDRTGGGVLLAYEYAVDRV